MAKRSLPQICSFACRFGDFPPPETAGLCRTMAAVYCRKLRRLVNKNAPCAWKAGRRPRKGGKGKP
jgi:hypothetical protein